MSFVRTIVSKLRSKSFDNQKTNHEAAKSSSKIVINPKDIFRLRKISTIVSDPQDVSNLRKVLLRIPSDETSDEKTYRQAYEAVQTWNHQYWTEHNQLFHQQRTDFINSNTTPDQPQLDAEKMAVFYRRFLNDNRQKHWSYNVEWYKRHLSLLPLDIRGRLSRLKLRLGC